MARTARPERASTNEYDGHRRAYYRFLHLLRWFLALVALVLGGVYFLIVDPAPVAGIFFMLVGVLVFGYAVLRTNEVARKRVKKMRSREERQA